jgi:hypothetical protein
VPEGVFTKHAKEYRGTGVRCVPEQDKPQLLSTPSYGVFYSVLAAGPTGPKGMDKDSRD